MKRTTEVRTI